MIQITGQAELIKTLTKLNSEIMPDVIAESVTRMAHKVRTEIRTEMVRVFDRPTTYTLRSMYVKPAKKNMSRIYAETGFIDYAGKGNPAAKYIRPEVEGGKRQLKGFELKLKAAGILPNGYYTAPGKGAKLNQYGNVSQTTIKQILDYAKSKRKTPKFVVLNEEDGNTGGVWKMGRGNSMVPILNFIKQPSYKSVLDINKIKDHAFKNNMARYTKEAFAKELNKIKA